MNAGSGTQVGCTVIDGAKLPPESGGEQALCDSIREAAAAGGPGQGFAVEVRVLSPSMLTATVFLPDGRRLPEQRLASADREFRKSAFERFARSLADLARAQTG